MQAQQREIAPQEENFAYEKTISNCRQKNYEKVQEVDMLRTKLEELDASEKHLKDELERALKKEEVTVQSETSTALSDSTEMEASRSMEVEGLGEKRGKILNDMGHSPRAILLSGAMLAGAHGTVQAGWCSVPVK